MFEIHRHAPVTVVRRTCAILKLFLTTFDTHRHAPVTRPSRDYHLINYGNKFDLVPVSFTKLTSNC